METGSGEMKRARGIKAGMAAALVFLALGTGIGMGGNAYAEMETPAAQMNAALPGQGSASDASTISLENASGDVLEATIAEHPELKRVHLTGLLPAPEELHAIQERFPSLSLEWSVLICGQAYEKETREMDLSGCEVTPEDLKAIAEYLPELAVLNLSGANVPWESLDAFVFEYPGIQCHYDVSLFGRSFPSDAEEVDLSGCRIEDLSQLEAFLPHFSSLKRLILSDCGQSSQALDELDRRLTDVRVVWTVNLGGILVRTDATWFMPEKFNKKVTDKDLVELQYCRDMICIDVGHMKVKTCDWAAGMANLQYLVLGDTRVTDISPLANHTKLVFLELFYLKLQDLSPLESCTALVDLNLSHVAADATPISRMTWLKRLWWKQDSGTRGLPAQCRPTEILPQALPNTQIKFDSKNSISDGWREGPCYYEMRDILGMFYIDS